MKVASEAEIEALGFGAVVEGERGERHMVICGGNNRAATWAVCLRPDAPDPIYGHAFRQGDIESLTLRWPRIIVETR